MSTTHTVSYGGSEMLGRCSVGMMMSPLFDWGVNLLFSVGDVGINDDDDQLIDHGVYVWIYMVIDNR